MENFRGPPSESSQHVTIVSVDSNSSNRPSLYKSMSTPGKHGSLKPQLTRTQSIKEKITNETAKFFGLAPTDATDADEHDDASADVRVGGGAAGEEVQKWQQRRFRHLKKEYGIRMDALADELQPKVGIDALSDLLVDEDGVPLDETPSQQHQKSRRPPGLERRASSNAAVFRARSMDGCAGAHLAQNYSTRRAATVTPPETRLSVAQMALSTINSILHGRAFRKSKRRCTDMGSAASFVNNTALSTMVRNGAGGHAGGEFLAPPSAATSDFSQGATANGGITDEAAANLSSGTYKSIREKNLGLASTSFPTFRHYAAASTVAGIAHADGMVRKISGFFGGVAPPPPPTLFAAAPPPTAAATSLNTAGTVRCSPPEDAIYAEKDGGETLNVQRNNSVSLSPQVPLEERRRRFSATLRPADGFHTLPTAKAAGGGSARRPDYLPLDDAAAMTATVGVAQNDASLGAVGAQRSVSALKARPSDRTQRKLRRSRIKFSSSPSVTNDDLFFDISPNHRPLENVRGAAFVLADVSEAESRPSFGLHEHGSPAEFGHYEAEEEALGEENRPSSSAAFRPQQQRRRFEAGSTDNEHRLATNMRLDESRHEHSALVRQESYELEDYATPVSDGFYSPISVCTSPKKVSMGGVQRVGFSTTNGERVEFQRPKFKGSAPPTAPITFKNSILRQFRWLKNLGRVDGEKLDSEVDVEESKLRGLRSMIKFQFSTRRGLSTETTTTTEARNGDVHSDVNEKETPTREPKRTLPFFGSIDPKIARQLKDESSDYRPFFTYWITTVQVMIMVFMLMQYGIGTDFSNGGIGVIERSGDVTATFISMIHIVIWEQNNVWIGPRFADLVHAGAKYTPCMRQDQSIHEQILRERREEADMTGCCIGTEGCFQGSECPKQFARLVKWSNTSVAEATHGGDGGVEGSARRVVCGQDPKYCVRPQSLPPFEWNRTDITKWPICVEHRPLKLIPKHAEHMHCTITGRPCCIQMHGQCRITTPEYCSFVRGYYHANATLCSQVSCLNSVCGMSPFLSADRPDQIYRLITPLFIHAGIIRCVITVVLQMTIMRNFEIMIGWLRMSIIYFVAGIGGYLASAVFVPYMPEVGPAGSQGAVLGALIVNVVYNWNFLRNPARVLIFHVAIAAVLFVTGFLPFIDNWAQLFGFIFGCLLAAALIPYIVFGKCDAARLRHRRFLVVGVSLSATVVLFLVLFTLFYGFPTTSFINYDVLSLLNCPFSEEKFPYLGRVCDQQSLRLRSWLPI